MSLFNTNGLVDAVAYGTLNEILGLGNSTDGMSRPNRYEVTLFPPTGYKGSRGNSTNTSSEIMSDFLGNGTVRSTGLRCESISLPGRTIDSTPDSNIYGPERDIATGYSFGDINATFQCSSDMREKIYWEMWQKMTFNPVTFDMQYYDDYVGTIDIHTLDEQDNRRYGVELVEAFPEDISTQALTGTQATAPMDVTVGFKYRYWRNLTDEAQLPKPLLDRLQNVLGNQVERQLLSRIPKVLRRL